MWLSRRGNNKYCYDRDKNGLSFGSPYFIRVTFLGQRLLRSLTLEKVKKKKKKAE